MLHWRRCSGLGRLNTESRIPNAACRLLPPASTPSRQARELLKRSGRTQEISPDQPQPAGCPRSRGPREALPTLLNLAATGISQLQTRQRQVLAKRPAEQTV
jgi:hypothetical protein